MTRPLLLAALVLSAAPATASPIGNPYGPTAGSGSWDGPGMTATELIGRPGDIGLAIDFSVYASTGTVLWSITARPDGRLTQSPYDGSWSYANGYDVFNTTADPKQFAYWEDEAGITVGVEDLTGPSDHDYNDTIVRFARLPERAQFDAVAEPSVLALAAVALFGVARRWRKGAR